MNDLQHSCLCDLVPEEDLAFLHFSNIVPIQWLANRAISPSKQRQRPDFPWILIVCTVASCVILSDEAYSAPYDGSPRMQILEFLLESMRYGSHESY
jgi:hypothetical protein